MPAIKKNPPLNSLKAFEATARHLSLVKAAKELRVTHSAVSQQIKLLEEYLELKLIERHKRNIRLTEIGRKYAKELNAAFSMIHAATDQLLNTQIITINMLTTFAMRWLIPRLAEFQSQHPNLEIRISTPGREIDFEHESIDMAIYYGKGNWPDLHVDFLFDEYLVPVCAPKLARNFKQMNLQKIINHNNLIYVKSEERGSAWQIWCKAMGLTKPKLSGNIQLQNSIQAIEAAINGLGITIAPDFFIQEEINTGRLVKLTEIKIKSPNSFYLVCSEAMLNQKKTQVLRQWLMSVVKEFLNNIN